MTGRDVKKIRDGLSLTPFAFAAMLGVAVSSVYRWEASKGNVKISSLHGEILEGLGRVVAAGIGLATGAKISKAILSGGSLAGLRVALDAITKEIPAHV